MGNKNGNCSHEKDNLNKNSNNEELMIKETDDKVMAMRPKSIRHFIPSLCWILMVLEIASGVLVFQFIQTESLFTTCYTLLFYLIFSTVLVYLIIILLKNAVKEYNTEYELFIRFKQAWLDRKAGFLPKKQ